MSDSIVIVSAARTPMGSFQGDFASLAAHDLGGAAINAAVARAGLQPALGGEVVFGHWLMAGQGPASARRPAASSSVNRARWAGRAARRRSRLSGASSPSFLRRASSTAGNGPVPLR